MLWPGVPVASLPDDPNAKTKRDSLPDCLQNPCDTGFGVNDIRIVANVKFLEANPAAETLLDLVEIPLEDIAAQNLRLFKGEDDADDIRRAEEWIEAVRNLVDE